MLLLSTGNEAGPPGSIALPHRELPIKWKGLNGIADEPKSSFQIEAWTFILALVPTHMRSLQLLTWKTYLPFSHFTHRLDPYAVMVFLLPFGYRCPALSRDWEHLPQAVYHQPQNYLLFFLLSWPVARMSPKLGEGGWGDMDSQLCTLPHSCFLAAAPCFLCLIFFFISAF